MLAVGISLLGLVVGGTLTAVVRRPPNRKDPAERDAGPVWARRAVVGPLTAVLFLAALWKFGGGAELFRACALVCVLVPLAVTDLRWGLLPNAITAPGLVVGLVLSAVADPEGWWTYPVGALSVGGGLLVVAAAYPGGMGMGDVKMGAMLGAFLGPYAALAVFAGAALGAVVGGLLMVTGALERGAGLPFGAFMAVAALLPLFFGGEIRSLYVGLV